jgi:hypothetical protein
LGKLNLVLPAEAKASRFDLDLAGAEAKVHFEDGRTVRAIACAQNPVIMLRISGKLDHLDFWAPGVDPAWFPSLGYPPPVLGRDETSRWYEQAVPAGTA